MKLKRIWNMALAGALSLAMGLVFVPGKQVQAAGGNIYSCTIHPHYAHPVTGEIEDSSSPAAFATGQGMVEGCLYTSGLLEITDSNEYYLNFRMSLVDYSSVHSFQVQSVGDSGWSGTNMAVASNGADNQGTTADIRIQVPSENCVVRGSMHVDPMGRDVIFYFYPSDFTEGNSVGMTPTVVTEETGAANQTTDRESEGGNSLQASGGTTMIDSAMPTKNASAPNKNQLNQNKEIEDKSEEIEQGSGATDGKLNNAKGLNLSTEEKEGEVAKPMGKAGLIVLITVCVLVIVCVIVGAVIFCRKNWNRWGGKDDE